MNDSHRFWIHYDGKLVLGPCRFEDLEQEARPETFEVGEASSEEDLGKLENKVDRSLAKLWLLIEPVGKKHQLHIEGSHYIFPQALHRLPDVAKSIQLGFPVGGDLETAEVRVIIKLDFSRVRRDSARSRLMDLVTEVEETLSTSGEQVEVLDDLKMKDERPVPEKVWIEIGVQSPGHAEEIIPTAMVLLEAKGLREFWIPCSGGED